jgi:hypothetical protein
MSSKVSMISMRCFYRSFRIYIHQQMKIEQHRDIRSSYGVYIYERSVTRCEQIIRPKRDNTGIPQSLITSIYLFGSSFKVFKKKSTITTDKLSKWTLVEVRSSRRSIHTVASVLKSYCCLQM